MSQGPRSSNPLDLTLRTGWEHGFALPSLPWTLRGSRPGAGTCRLPAWSELTSPSRASCPAAGWKAARMRVNIHGAGHSKQRAAPAGAVTASGDRGHGLGVCHFIRSVDS